MRSPLGTRFRTFSSIRVSSPYPVEIGRRLDVADDGTWSDTRATLRTAICADVMSMRISCLRRNSKRAQAERLPPDAPGCRHDAEVSASRARRLNTQLFH